MNTKEKYYNFIIDDLVRNTEMDYEKEEILPPFYFFNPPSFHFFANSILHSYSIPVTFTKHVTELYGVRDEEVDFIWDLYRNIIFPLITK